MGNKRDNVHATAAPDPVKCPDSPTGKHRPRTIEGVVDGVRIKRSVCRDCHRVA